MATNENEGKGLLDQWLDKAEAAIGGLERVADASEGIWKADEIIDAENGDRVWNVSDDGTRKIHTWSESLAKRLCGALNK